MEKTNVHLAGSQEYAAAPQVPVSASHGRADPAGSTPDGAAPHERVDDVARGAVAFLYLLVFAHIFFGWMS